MFKRLIWSYLVVGFIKRGSIYSTVRSRKNIFLTIKAKTTYFRFLSVTNITSLMPPRSGVTLRICENYIITQLIVTLHLSLVSDLSFIGIIMKATLEQHARYGIGHVWPYYNFCWRHRVIFSLSYKFFLIISRETFYARLSH